MRKLKYFKGYWSLTKKERNHIIGWLDDPSSEFELCLLFEAQAKMRRDRHGVDYNWYEPCWTCREIAQKLGYSI